MHFGRTLVACACAAIAAGCSSSSDSPATLPSAPLAQISVGHEDDGQAVACGVDEGGRLFCWGTSRFGGLGLGHTDARPEPELLGTGWSSVSAGRQTCGTKQDGTLHCWGYIGSGFVPDLYSTATPVQVGSDADWARAGPGNDFLCALKTGGTLHCWGPGYWSRRGEGATPSHTMGEVTAGSGTRWTALAADGQHACATRDDLTLWCWGANGNGQLGDGTTSPRTTVFQVPGEWIATSVSPYTSCGVKVDGSLHCWGYVVPGGAFPLDTRSPAQIGSALDWAGVAVGMQHVCAWNAAGDVTCWGSNTRGQLGSGTATALAGECTPAVSVRAVEAGGDATCGLTDAGRLLCWGGNGPGTLGLPRSGDKRTPSRFMPGRAFSAAAAGSQSTCGISGGELWCAGTNAWLEDGDSSGLSFWSQTPVRIGAARDWRSVSAGERHLCGIRGTGASARGYCWGWNDHGELGYDGAASVDPVQIGSVGEWEALSAAGDHVCGIRREDGALHCWGYAGSGELGDGGTTSRSTPAPVAGGGAWTAVHGVSASRCAVRSDGTLHCWGDNLAGQLGVGDTTARWEPTQVGTLDGWTRSATGYYHSCGIRDGAMFCWGANGWGALGTDGGSSDVPVPVAAGTAFQEVAAGGMHTCAISDGRMFCWGTNRHGEAGDGSTVADARLPARVGEASDWTHVAAGRMHSCGLRAGGSLWCWGWNGSGQLGDGTAWYPSPVAVRIPP